MFQKIKNFYHLIQAIIANVLYGFPSHKLKVIGVTGTDGKTTTTHLIAHILKKAGKKVSFVSSVYASVAGKESDTGFHVTTPDSFALQKLIKQSRDNHDEYFVLETTSHALDQNRVWGINYEVGVITNITHEHLDYHKTYEEYAKIKLKLLRMAKVGIKNSDKVEDRIKKIPNLTKFNQYNYSSAFRVCKALGLTDKIVLQAMQTFELPKGRVDLVYDKDFRVVIDFAHTPNALLQILPAMRELFLKKNGRLIHVFGSAGLRDVTKRPLMGEISGKYSDVVILTEEDYRTEDPIQICQAIEAGLEKENVKRINYDQLINCSGKSYSVIINREKAIREAVKIAKKDDIVILTGKAHEKSLCRGKMESPWDEYEAVKKALKL